MGRRIWYRTTVIFHGEVMDTAPIEDITYGYVGAAMYPNFMLYYEGTVNMKNSGNRYISLVFFLINYGDALEDIEVVMKGIVLWKKKGICFDD